MVILSERALVLEVLVSHFHLLRFALLNAQFVLLNLILDDIEELGIVILSEAFHFADIADHHLI